MKKKLTIGITGGIGSGKSIVSDIIEKAGYTVIRSDDIAKELMVTDKKLMLQIKKAFSDEAYVDSRLNTKYLAKTVFNDVKINNKINSIVHPPVIKKIRSMIKYHLKKKNIVFVESALIFEAKMENMFDIIMLVYSNKSTRLKRATARDGVTKAEVLKRMNLQMPDKDKKFKSHFVIENNSSLEELHNRTFFFLSVISHLSIINYPKKK